MNWFTSARSKAVKKIADFVSNVFYGRMFVMRKYFLIFIFEKRGVKSETVTVRDDWRGIETFVSKEKPNTANIIENPFWFRLCQYKSNHKRKTNNRKTSYEQRNHKIKSIPTKSQNRFSFEITSCGWDRESARGKMYEVKDLRKTNHARARLSTALIRAIMKTFCRINWAAASHWD